MGLGDTAYGIFLANAIEGLRKKPSLVIHFLLSLSIGSFIIWLGRAIPALQPIYMAVSNWFAVGSNRWALLAIIAIILFILHIFLIEIDKENAHKDIYLIFGNIVNNITKFIDVMTTREIYSFLRDALGDRIGSANRLLLLMVINYYAMWIITLYAIDVALYAFVGRSFLSYFAQSIFRVALIFVLAVGLSLAIKPWGSAEEELQKGDDLNLQYFRGIMDRFFSFEMLASGGLKRALRFASRLLVNIIALPRFGDLERPVVDQLQIVYSKTPGSDNKVKKLPGDVLENMLSENPVYDYKLVPLNEDRCKSIPTINVPHLSNACWYVVCKKAGDEQGKRSAAQLRGLGIRRRVDDKQGERSKAGAQEGGCGSGWRPVGYAMILVFRDREKLQEDKVIECLERAERCVMRGDNSCGGVISELRRKYSQSRDVLYVLLLGTIDVVGFKMHLIYPP